VFQSLALAVNTQINQVHKLIGRDAIETLINVPLECFTPCLGNISSFALKECLNQFNKIKTIDPTEPCSQTITIGLGISCSHRIKEIIEGGNALDPNDFHSQWHLKYNPEITVSNFFSWYQYVHLLTLCGYHSPGENLWHWHASATPCVFTGTRCQ
jgi:hypothetical protein